MYIYIYYIICTYIYIYTPAFPLRTTSKSLGDPGGGTVEMLPPRFGRMSLRV